MVAGACKPKHAPPKAKYVDALVSSTHSSDGSLQDVTRSLSQRLRDPSSTVVFKCLLVIHTLIRAGNSEEVMPYWSGADGRDGARSLGLLAFVNMGAVGDVSGNMVRYAHYLGSRLKAYAVLKHDPIRTRAEAPASLGGAGNRRSTGAGAGGPNRLRTLTVEKGLLREVSTLQKLLDSLVECKVRLQVALGWLFERPSRHVVLRVHSSIKTRRATTSSCPRSDSSSRTCSSSSKPSTKASSTSSVRPPFLAPSHCCTPHTLPAEHYFEMSKVDATQALKTYKIFCRQCEKVVAYLGVAKKLSSIINVNVPNLRHAPVSLAGSLQEYLDDPNFEQNREEYKESKLIADGKKPAPKPKETSGAWSDHMCRSGIASCQGRFGHTAAPSAATSSTAAPSRAAAGPAAPAADTNKTFQDFFASIESEQQDMFNPQTGSSFFQQNQAWNPFGPQPVQQQMMYAQPTGFAPGPSTMGQSLFGVQQQPQQLQPQVTGFAFGGQMAPQMTGAANPFRQSTMFVQSQPTGFPPQQQAPNPFGQQQQGIQPQQTGYNPFLQQQQQQQPQPTGFPASSAPFTNGSFSAAPPNRLNGASSAPPTQNQPSPFSSLSPSSSSPAPLTVQPTGSRNPFAPPPGSVPPPPKSQSSTGPSLNTLAMSAWEKQMKEQQVREEAARLQAEQAQNRQSEQQGFANGSNGVDGAKGKAPQTNGFSNFFSSQLERLEGGGKATVQANKTGAGGLFSDVASQFATTRPRSAGDNPFPSAAPPAAAGGANGQSFLGGAQPFSSSPTSTNPPFSSPFGPSGGQPAAIAPQPTGFGGSSVKPFKPTSSFGTSLASSLPPVAEGIETLAGQPTGMAPQPTGANPFRMSTMPTGLSSQPTSLSSQPTGFSGFSTLSSSMTGSTAPAFSGIKPFQPTSSFGQGSFGPGAPNGATNGMSMPQTSAAPPVSLI